WSARNSASVGDEPQYGRSIRAPCSNGQSPVNMVTCDGRVHGAAERAMSNVIPSFAQESSWGVVDLRYPYRLMWSARTVSMTIQIRLGALEVGRDQARSSARVTLPH